MVHSCKTLADFEQLQQNSYHKPVFLFKHSSICPVSSRAWQEFKQFLSANPTYEYWRVLAVEDRALSRQIAEICGVTHQSPQVILFHQGQAIWHQSHLYITSEALLQAVQSLIPSTR
ncbi:MAG: bacillithiol system redox-active protein YtxJ [Gemmatimonadetes bacterium]|nr:MAG: bacillithiol system redox-active protein YtxJ [Gemmatimonadota bacterium]